MTRTLTDGEIWAEINAGCAGAVTMLQLQMLHIDKNQRMLGNITKTTIDILANQLLTINDKYAFIYIDTTITVATALDVGVIEAGKDYYIYACDNSGILTFKVSLASTFPTGYTTTTSRKIGGFHTLCVNVGVIAGHTLTGYVANDILPQSVWDLKFRCRNANNIGMVYDPYTTKWVQIYLASDNGASGVQSVYNATILDTLDWMTFVDRGAKVGVRLLDDDQFQAIAEGSNQQTNIVGSADPVTTGGHSDTAGRRMISNIGCEDCTGAMWQWLITQSFRLEGSHQHTENIDVAYTQNALTTLTDIATWNWYTLPGSKGSLYRQGTYGDIKFLAGGAWYEGSDCGSWSRTARYSRWDASSSIGGRFCAEPL